MLRRGTELFIPSGFIVAAGIVVSAFITGVLIKRGTELAIDTVKSLRRTPVLPKFNAQKNS